MKSISMCMKGRESRHADAMKNMNIINIMSTLINAVAMRSMNTNMKMGVAVMRGMNTNMRKLAVVMENTTMNIITTSMGNPAVAIRSMNIATDAVADMITGILTGTAVVAVRKGSSAWRRRISSYIL